MYRSHIIVGDTNINILKDCILSNGYLNTMYEFGNVSAMNEVTREGNDQESCIDHIFIKTRMQLNIHSLLVKKDVTDHYPTILEIKKQDV